MAFCPKTSEVGVKRVSVDAELLGYFSDAYRPSLKQSRTDLDVFCGQFLASSSLTTMSKGCLEPFHRPLSVEVEEILRDGSVELTGKPAVGGFAVELLGEAWKVYVLLSQSVDGPHHLASLSAN